MTWYREPASQPVQVARSVGLKDDSLELLLMLFCMFDLLSICTPCELFLCSCVTISGTVQNVCITQQVGSSHNTPGGCAAC